MSVIKSLILVLFPVAASIVGASANAAVVDFEDKGPASSCPAGNQTSGGLDFATGAGFTCFYTVAEPSDFPTAITSTVAGFGFGDVAVTPTAGGVFNLTSIDLAFGPFEHSGAVSDTTLLTGYVFGGGTLTALLTVGYGFETHTLDWTNLTSFSLGQLAANGEYLAVDNIVYGVGGVPEPATWALMIGGFGLVGAAMRRRTGVVAA